MDGQTIKGTIPRGSGGPFYSYSKIYPMGLATCVQGFCKSHEKTLEILNPAKLLWQDLCKTSCPATDRCCLLLSWLPRDQVDSPHTQAILLLSPVPFK